MGTSKNKLSTKEWEDSLNRMTYGELQRIIEEPDIYYPEYWELAKKKKDELSSTPEHEVMKNRIVESLKELGCPCELTEDGDLDFWFRGGHFFIILKEDSHYIEIVNYCWKTVSLDDAKEIERLRHAVNYANSMTTVNTVYYTDEEENIMGVYCTTSILYRPTITELKDYLCIRLQNFFLAHDFVNTDMLLADEREKLKQLEQIKVDKLPIC